MPQPVNLADVFASLKSERWQDRDTAIQQTIGSSKPMAMSEFFAPTPPLQEPPSLLGGLASSFASAATTEFVGGSPLEGAAPFRARHPVLGAVSYMAGFMVPAIGISALTSGAGAQTAIARLPAIGKALTAARAGKVATELPVVQQAARFAAIAATEETGRLGLSGVVKAMGGPASPSQVASEIPFNVVAGGVLGAGAGGLRYIVRAKPNATFGDVVIAKHFPEYNIWEKVPQYRLRQLLEFRAREVAGQNRQTVIEALDNSIRGTSKVTKGDWHGLEHSILNAEPEAGKVAYVRTLESPTANARKYHEVMKVRPWKETWKWVPKGNMAGVAMPRTTPGVKGKPIRRVGAHKAWVTRKFVLGKGGFSKKSGIDPLAYLKKHLGEDALAHGAYFRHVEAVTEEAATRITDQLLGPMRKIGRNSWWVRERDGMFLVAKRVTKKSKLPGEEFIFFKTDDLGHFFPQMKQYRATVPDEMWLPKAETKWMSQAQKGIESGRTLAAIEDALPAPRVLGDVPENARRAFLRKYLPEQVVTDFGEYSQRARRLFREHFSPILGQFSSNPRAQRMMAKARAMYQSAEARSIREFAGLRAGPAGNNLYRAIFLEGDRATGGIRDQLRQLSKEDIKNFFNHIVLIDDLKKFDWKASGYSKELRDFTRALVKLDKAKINEQTTVEGIVAGKTYISPPGSIMLTRAWKGNVRIPILETVGTTENIVGFASGRSAKAAIEDAKKIVAAANQRAQAAATAAAKAAKPGTKKPPVSKFLFNEGDVTVAGRLEDARSIQEVYAMTGRRGHRFFKEALIEVRQGGGVKGKPKLLGWREDWTHKDLEDKIFGHLIETNKRIYGSLVKESLQADLKWLKRVDPSMHEQFMTRLDRMDGKTGNFSKWVNKKVDSILNPIFPALGADSATSIARAFNTAAFHLTLTAGDLGFPALNAVTFMQTVLPEIAMIGSATPEALQHLYTAGLVANAGKIRPLAWLDPLKISGRAMNIMRKADTETLEFVQRAMRDGTVNPRMAEEFLGKLTDNISWKAVKGGTESFGDFLTAINSWMPAKSEEFARVHALVVGKVVGKELLGLSGNRLYSFSSEFVNRTMFLYSQPMRSHVLTGPVGNLFGLFKNWQFHYFNNFMHYAGEGVSRKNWTPMLWSMVGTGTVAGAGGMPLYFAADAFSKMASDKTLMENLYSMSGYENLGWAGKRSVDSLYYGLPAFLGVALQSRGEVPTSDPIRDVTSLTNVASLERFGWAGKAFVESWDTWNKTGNHPLRNPKARDLWYRALAPRTWYRVVQVAQEGGIRSLSTGNRVIDDVNILERLGYAAGLTSVDIQKGYDKASILAAEDLSMDKTVNILGKLAAEARLNEDWDAFDAVMRDVIALGAPHGRVVKSHEAYMNQQRGDSADRLFEFRRNLQLEAILGTLPDDDD